MSADRPPAVVAPPSPAPALAQTAAQAVTRRASVRSSPLTAVLPASSTSTSGAPLTRTHTNPQSVTQSSADVPYPGTIKINVQGAFIVDEPPSPCMVGKEAFVDGDGNLDTEGVEYKHDIQDIRLPNHTAIVSHVAVDIGGSLCKLVYFSHEPGSIELGGRLNFLKFETDRIGECIDLMRKLQHKHRQQLSNGIGAGAGASSKANAMSVMATGGGAFKYYDEMKRALGVEVLREDEMECLIIGLDFFIQEIPAEVFTHSSTAPSVFLPPRTDIYPYLLVNIGSGVSMIKVSGPRAYQRIGGTSLGGGTLWGLLSLITGARSFDDMLAMADRGDNTAVDMLVGDIYGTGYGKIGLKADTIASSFGKVYKMKREAEREAEDIGGLANDEMDAEGDSWPSGIAFRPEDISRSLLYAVSYNIGQLAHLQSTIHSLPHIYFGGSFIRGHRQTMNTLSYAIDFWSGGKKQAYFLRHEGYLGAVGAFLKRQPRNWGRRNSFDEIIRPAAAPSSAESMGPTGTVGSAGR